VRKVNAALLIAIFTALVLAAVAGAQEMEGMDSGGSDNAMGAMGKHLTMSDHMTITQSRPETPEDLKRANLILSTMREKLQKYQDYKAAEADGYEPYMESVPQDVYHFANREATMAEYAGDFDLAHPGSLLYEKNTFGGYKLVGAMYDAPPHYTPDQLDKLIPLSIGHWHAHTNICLPSGVTEQDVMNGNVGARMRPDISSAVDRATGRSFSAGSGLRMRLGYLADARFGFQGTISNQADCDAAGGTFHPQIFGWMIHVYPFAGDDLKVAFGTDAP
jgi:hypothetical protein